MSSSGADELQDEMALHWNWLEEEPDPSVVVSARMEFVFANAAARAGWCRSTGSASIASNCSRWSIRP